MSRDVATFADEWVQAWNAHDLDRILAHYHPDASVRSPLAAVRRPESGGVVVGHAALRAYWGPALEAGSQVRFELERALATVDGCTLLYRNQRGRLVAETVVWDADGLVTDAVVSYDEEPAPSPRPRYLVVERFVQGPRPVYERLATHGRMLPDGLERLDSWIAADGDGEGGGAQLCYQLMETDDPALFDGWTARWADLVSFEIHPVVDSATAAARAGQDPGGSNR